MNKVLPATGRLLIQCILSASLVENEETPENTEMDTDDPEPAARMEVSKRNTPPISCAATVRERKQKKITCKTLGHRWYRALARPDVKPPGPKMKNGGAGVQWAPKMGKSPL